MKVFKIGEQLAMLSLHFQFSSRPNVDKKDKTYKIIYPWKLKAIVKIIAKYWFRHVSQYMGVEHSKVGLTFYVRFNVLKFLSSFYFFFCNFYLKFLFERFDI